MKIRLMALVLACILLLSVIPVMAETAEIENFDKKIEVYIVHPWQRWPQSPQGESLVLNFVEEKWGGDWSVTPASDDQSELVTRMASGNEPDIIVFGNYTELTTFYEQGVLLDDWNAYADKLPTYLKEMEEQQIAYYTSDEGKLMAVATEPGDQAWSLMIRKDWLANLGLNMPTTPDELLEVMRAFTFNDPDGDGENNTYGFTAAGGGGVGEMRQLLRMFGHPDLYITEDGEVSNAILDGSFKEYLDFAKIVSDEGLINPDWYTISWNDRKPALFRGEFGICYYPPAALYEEIINNLELKGEDADALIDQWDLLDLCGGKGVPLAPTGGGPVTVSAKTAEDPVKMDIICSFLEDTTANVEDYANIAYTCAMGIPGMGYKSDNDTYLILFSDNTLVPADVQEWWNTYTEGQIRQVNNRFLGKYFNMNTMEVPKWAEHDIELTKKVLSEEKYSNEYMLYPADATLKADLDNLVAEFEIAYIIGETTDYDGFVESWYTAGGQDYLDGAKECFQKLGFIQ